MKKLFALSVLTVMFAVNIQAQIGSPGRESVLANWTYAHKDTSWTAPDLSANYRFAIQVESTGLSAADSYVKVQTMCSKCTKWVTCSGVPSDSIALPTTGAVQITFEGTAGGKYRLYFNHGSTTTGTSIKAWIWGIKNNSIQY